MSEWDDTDDVLHRLRLTDDDERLLAGDRSDDAPVGVAALLAALREPGRAQELTGTEELLTQMNVAINAAANADDVAGRVAGRPMLRLVSGKIAAIAAVTLFSAGAAAAATGTLPDPIQQRVANTVAHVGIDLDRPSDEPTPPTIAAAATTSVPTPSVPTTMALITSEPTSSGPPTSGPATSGPATTGSSAVSVTLPESIVPVGPDAPSAAASGLCTAYRLGEQNGNHLDSTAMQQLADVAAAQELTIEAFCSQVVGTTVPATHGGQPDNPGNSGSTPAVTAPGQTSDQGRPAAPGKPADPGNKATSPSITAPATTPSHRP